MSATLGELAKYADVTLKGNADCIIHTVNTLKKAKSGEISFLSNRRYASLLSTTEASAVILSEQDSDNCPVSCLVSDNPYLTYAKVTNYLYPRQALSSGISDSAIIGKDCTIANDVYIESGVVIGDGVTIGSDCYIAAGSVIKDGVSLGEQVQVNANVTLCDDVTIGNNVILHPGVVIGADGFGLAQDETGWLKIPQLGSVIIHDDVEIGANTTIDRGAIEDTVIQSGVKIDNQVQVGHNVIIGKNTVIAGCTALAGSCVIGERCIIGGACAISGHIEIADNVTITGMSAVSNSIKSAGLYSSGIPVTENRIWLRNITRFKHLDETFKKILNKLD